MPSRLWNTSLNSMLAGAGLVAQPLRTASLASLGALAGGTLKYLRLRATFCNTFLRSLQAHKPGTLDLSGNNISQLKELHAYRTPSDALADHEVSCKPAVH